MRKLEIGPGAERIPGFETLNAVKSPITDHLGRAEEPPFPDNTFDLIYSSHCIEHVQWYVLESTIKQWVRILKPNGVLEVWTVNGYALMKCLVEYEETGNWTGPTPGTWQNKLTNYDPYKWAIGRLLNYVKKNSYWHLHRSIITPKYMQRVFSEAGLINIREMDRSEVRGKDHGWINMGFYGVKPE